MSGDHKDWVGSIETVGRERINPWMRNWLDFKRALVGFERRRRDLRSNLLWNSPDFKLLEELVVIWNWFQGCRFIFLNKAQCIVLRAHWEDKVIAVRDQNEVICNANCSSTFIVRENAHYVDITLRLQMMETLIIHIGEYKVFWTWLDNVIGVLSERSRHLRESFAAVAAVNSCLSSRRVTCLH